jgi:phasin family protein
MAFPQRKPVKPAAADNTTAQAVAPEQSTSAIPNETVAPDIDTTAEATALLDSAAEQSLEPSAAAFVGSQTVADKATFSLEASYSGLSKGMQEFSARSLANLQANTAATFDLIKALSGVTTASEAITLQTEHARKQYETLTAQAKELTTLAQKIVSVSAAPLKGQFGKGF